MLFFLERGMSMLRCVSHYYSYKWDKDGYLLPPPNWLKNAAHLELKN